MKKQYGPWSVHFAWIPVQVRTGYWRWFVLLYKREYHSGATVETEYADPYDAWSEW